MRGMYKCFDRVRGGETDMMKNGSGRREKPCLALFEYTTLKDGEINEEIEEAERK